MKYSQGPRSKTWNVVGRGGGGSRGSNYGGKGIFSSGKFCNKDSRTVNAISDILRC